MNRRDDSMLLERERLANLAITMSHLVTTAQPLQHILQQCAEALVWHLDVAFARIWLLNDRGDTLLLRASAGAYTDLNGRYSRVPMSTSLKIGRIVAERQPMLTNRLQEEGWVREPEWARAQGFIAYAGYPLITQNRVVGVMAMFSRQELRERMLDELEAISGGIAQCVVRSQAEEALRASQERLLLAVDGAGMALWDWNVLTNEMVWSDRYFSLLGYNPCTTNASLDAWRLRIHPEDRDAVMQQFSRSRQHRSLFMPDYRVVRADTDDVIWVTARGRFLYGDDGWATRMICAHFNISHRKQAEAEIHRLLEEAQRRERELRDKQAQLVQAAKLASIGELTTGIAHELNNPLNNIGLFIGNALDQVEEAVAEPAKARIVDNLHSAGEQVQRAAMIINGLRIFGRAPERVYQPIAINKVAAAAASLLAESARLAGVTLVCDLDSREPRVQGCPIQLEQVLVNLLSNAIDAVNTQDRKVVTLATARRGEQVEVEVRDTGVGISGDVLPRIFDPFFTTKEVGVGTGLGLSIAYGIVKEHHGDITVMSRVGEGTEFRILLPSVKEAP